MSLDKTDRERERDSERRKKEKEREFTFCSFYSLSYSAIRVWHAEFTNDDLAMTYPFTLNDFDRVQGDRDSRINESQVYMKEEKKGNKKTYHLLCCKVTCSIERGRKKVSKETVKDENR